MYREFYRLREGPFSLTPDPKYLFLTDGHKEALAAVAYGVQERKGFVLILGEVGTGKTTIIRHILKQFGDRLRVVYVLNARVTFEELLRITLRELEIRPASGQRLDMIDALNDFLLAEAAAGRSVVMIIDEAQHLTVAVLEEIRMLSNLETAQGKLLQIVLVGQPELGHKLAQAELRQLRQRIGLVAELKPLTAAETAGYIAHRLRIAGAPQPQLFTRRALRKIYRASGGLPRLVNVICDKALILGYAASARRIRGRLVRLALADRKVFERAPDRRALTKRGLGPRQARPRLLRPLAAALVVTVVVWLGWLVLGRDERLAFPVPTIGALAPVTTAPVSPASAPAAVSAPPVALPVTPVAADLSPRGSEIAGETALPGVAAATETTPRTPAPAAAPVDRELVVSAGDTLGGLVNAVYGRVDLTLLDVVRQANPSVTDVDVIVVGQRLRFPPVGPDTMVWKADGGRYAVHLATVLSAADGEFERLRARVEQEGLTLRAVPTHLAANFQARRLVVGDFQDHRAAEVFYRRYGAPVKAPAR